MAAQTYRLISHTVEAEQLCPENAQGLSMWCGGMVIDEYDAEDKTKHFVAMNVPTIMGMKRAQEGDFIIKDQMGLVTVMRKNQFESKYELAE